MMDQLQKRKKLKLIAGLCAAAFFAQDLAWAAPELMAAARAATAAGASAVESSMPAVRFTLPESVGVIDDHWQAPAETASAAGRAGRLVILIQDAHTNVSGQLNLARALEHILPAESVRTVYTEGAEGDVSLRFLRDRVAPRKMNGVLLEYLKKGIVKGDDYWNAVSDHDFALRGIEDMDLYRESLETYGRTVRLRGTVRPYLDRTLRSALSLEPNVYTPAMRRLEASRQARRAGERSEADHITFLLRTAREEGVDLSRFRNAVLFEKYRALESRLDADRLAREQREAFGALSEADRQELRPALDASVRSPMDTAYARAFGFALREKLGPAVREYPELKKYFAYLSKVSRIHFSSLLSEGRELEDALVRRLASTSDAVTLHETVRSLEDLSDLVQFKIAPEEFARLDRLRAFSDLRPLTGWINAKLAESGRNPELAVFLEREAFEAIRSARRFYELTYERDRVMLERTIARMDAAGETRAVLIAGGFHAPGLKARLREAGISYVSVMPQVLHETDSARYEKLLLAQVRDSRAVSGIRVASAASRSASGASAIPAQDLSASARLGAPLLGPEGARLATALGDPSLEKEARERNRLFPQGARMADTAVIEPATLPSADQPAPKVSAKTKRALEWTPRQLEELEALAQRVGTPSPDDVPEERDIAFERSFEKFLIGSGLDLHPSMVRETVYAVGSLQPLEIEMLASVMGLTGWRREYLARHDVRALAQAGSDAARREFASEILTRLFYASVKMGDPVTGSDAMLQVGRELSRVMDLEEEEYRPLQNVFKGFVLRFPRNEFFREHTTLKGEKMTVLSDAGTWYCLARHQLGDRTARRVLERYMERWVFWKANTWEPSREIDREDLIRFTRIGLEASMSQYYLWGRSKLTTYADHEIDRFIGIQFQQYSPLQLPKHRWRVFRYLEALAMAVGIEDVLDARWSDQEIHDRIALAAANGSVRLSKEFYKGAVPSARVIRETRLRVEIARTESFEELEGAFEPSEDGPYTGIQPKRWIPRFWDEVSGAVDRRSNDPFGLWGGMRGFLEAVRRAIEVRAHHISHSSNNGTLGLGLDGVMEYIEAAFMLGPAEAGRMFGKTTASTSRYMQTVVYPMMRMLFNRGLAHDPMNMPKEKAAARVLLILYRNTLAALNAKDPEGFDTRKALLEKWIRSIYERKPLPPWEHQMSIWSDGKFAQEMFGDSAKNKKNSYEAVVKAYNRGLPAEGARMAGPAEAELVRPEGLLGADPFGRVYRTGETVGAIFRRLEARYRAALKEAIASTASEPSATREAFERFETERRGIVQELRTLGVEAMARRSGGTGDPETGDFRGDYRVALLAFNRALEMRPLTRSLLEKAVSGSAYVPAGDIFPQLPAEGDRETANLETERENAYKRFVSTTPIGTVAAENLVYDLQISHQHLLEGRVETVSGRPLEPSLGDMAAAMHGLIFDEAYRDDPRVHYGVKTMAAKWLAQLYGVSIRTGKPLASLDPRGGLMPMYRTVEALREAESLEDYQAVAEDLLFYFWTDPARPEAGLEGHSAKTAEHLADCYRGLASKLEQLHVADSIDLEFDRSDPARAELMRSVGAAGSFDAAWETYERNQAPGSSELTGGALTAFEVEQPVRLELSAGGIGDLSGNAVLRPAQYNIFNAAAEMTRSDGTMGPNVRVFGEVTERAEGGPYLTIESIDRGFRKHVRNAEDILGKSNADLILRAMIASGIFPKHLLELAVAEGRSEEAVERILARLIGPGKSLTLRFFVDNIEANSGLAVSSAIALATGLTVRRLTQADLSNGRRRTESRQRLEWRMDMAEPMTDDEVLEIEMSSDPGFASDVFHFKTRAVGDRVRLEIPSSALVGGQKYHFRWRAVPEAAIAAGSVQDGRWVPAGGLDVAADGSVEPSDKSLMVAVRLDAEWERLDSEDAARKAMLGSQLTGWQKGEKSGTQDEVTAQSGLFAVFGGAALEGKTVDGRHVKYPGGVLPDIQSVLLSEEALRKLENGVQVIRVGLTDAAEDSLNAFDQSHALSQAPEAVMAWGQITLEMIRAAAAGDIRQLGRLAQASVALRQKIGAVSINPIVLNALQEFSKKWGARGVSYGITGARSTGSVLIFIPDDVDGAERARILEDAAAFITASVESRGKLSPVEDRPKVYRGRIARVGTQFRAVAAEDIESWKSSVEALRIANRAARVRMRRDLALNGSGENPRLIEDDFPSAQLVPAEAASQSRAARAVAGVTGRTRLAERLNVLIDDPSERDALLNEAGPRWSGFAGAQAGDEAAELRARRAARQLLQEIFPSIRPDRSFETADLLAGAGIEPGRRSGLERIPGVLSIAPDLLAVIADKDAELHAQILRGDPAVKLDLRQLELWKQEAIDRRYAPYGTRQNHLTARLVREGLEANLTVIRTLTPRHRAAVLELVRTGELNLQYPYTSAELAVVAERHLSGGEIGPFIEVLLADGRQKAFEDRAAKSILDYRDTPHDPGFAGPAFLSDLERERKGLEEGRSGLSPLERLRLDLVTLAPDPEHLDLTALEFAVSTSQAYRKHFSGRLEILRAAVRQGSVVGWTAAGGVGGRYGGGNVVKPVMPFHKGMESDVTFLGLMLRRWAGFFDAFEDGDPALSGRAAPMVGILVSMFTQDAILKVLDRLKAEAGLESVGTVETGVEPVTLPTAAEAALEFALKPKGNAQRQEEDRRQLEWLVRRIEEELEKRRDAASTGDPDPVRTTFTNVGLNPLNGFAPKGTASNLEGMLAENSAIFTEASLIAAGYQLDAERLAMVPAEERLHGMPLAKAAMVVRGDGLSLVWLLQSSSVAPLTPVHLADALERMKRSGGLAVLQYAPAAGGTDTGGVVFIDRTTGLPAVLEGSLFRYGERSVFDGGHAAMTTGNMFLNAKRLHEILLQERLDASATLAANRPDLGPAQGFASAEDYLSSSLAARREAMEGWMQRAVTAYQVRPRTEQKAGETYQYLIQQAERPFTVNLPVFQEMFGGSAVQFQEISAELFADPKDPASLDRLMQQSRIAGSVGYRASVPPEPSVSPSDDGAAAEWLRIYHSYGIAPDSVGPFLEDSLVEGDLEHARSKFIEYYLRYRSTDMWQVPPTRIQDMLHKLSGMVRYARMERDPYLEQEALALFDRFAAEELKRAGSGAPYVRTSAHRTLGIYDKDGTIEDPAKVLWPARARRMFEALLRGETHIILTGSTAKEAWEQVLVPLIAEAERRTDLPKFIRSVALSRILLRANDSTSLVRIDTGLESGEWRSDSFKFRPQDHEHSRIQTDDGALELPTLRQAHHDTSDVSQRVQAIEDAYKAYLKAYLDLGFSHQVLTAEEIAAALAALEKLSLPKSMFGRLEALPSTDWLTRYHSGDRILAELLKTAEAGSGDEGILVWRRILDHVSAARQKISHQAAEPVSGSAEGPDGIEPIEALALGITLSGIKESAWSYLSLTADELDHLRQTDTREEIAALSAAIFDKGFWEAVGKDMDRRLTSRGFKSMDGRPVPHTIRSGEGYVNVPFGGQSKIQVLGELLRDPVYSGWVIHISGDSKTDQGRVPESPALYADRIVARVFLGDRTEMSDTETARLTRGGLIRAEFLRTEQDVRGDRVSQIARPGPAMFFDIQEALLDALDGEGGQGLLLPVGEDSVEGSAWRLARETQRIMNSKGVRSGYLVLPPAALAVHAGPGPVAGARVAQPQPDAARTSMTYRQVAAGILTEYLKFKAEHPQDTFLIMVHGDPGSGKTTFIEYLVFMLKKDFAIRVHREDDRYMSHHVSSMRDIVDRNVSDITIYENVDRILDGPERINLAVEFSVDEAARLRRLQSDVVSGGAEIRSRVHSFDLRQHAAYVEVLGRIPDYLIDTSYDLPLDDIRRQLSEGLEEVSGSGARLTAAPAHHSAGSQVRFVDHAVAAVRERGVGRARVAYRGHGTQLVVYGLTADQGGVDVRRGTRSVTPTGTSGLLSGAEPVRPRTTGFDPTEIIRSKQVSDAAADRLAFADGAHADTDGLEMSVRIPVGSLFDETLDAAELRTAAQYLIEEILRISGPLGPRYARRATYFLDPQALEELAVSERAGAADAVRVLRSAAERHPGRFVIGRPDRGHLIVNWTAGSGQRSDERIGGIAGEMNVNIGQIRQDALPSLRMGVAVPHASVVRTVGAERWQEFFELEGPPEALSVLLSAFDGSWDANEQGAASGLLKALQGKVAYRPDQRLRGISFSIGARLTEAMRTLMAAARSA